MKKEYVKPSMAMNLFEATDSTNAINVLSTVAQTRTTSGANKYGINVIGVDKLNS